MKVLYLDTFDIDTIWPGFNDGRCCVCHQTRRRREWAARWRPWRPRPAPVPALTATTSAVAAHRCTWNHRVSIWWHSKSTRVSATVRSKVRVARNVQGASGRLSSGKCLPPSSWSSLVKRRFEPSNDVGCDGLPGPSEVGVRPDWPVAFLFFVWLIYVVNPPLVMWTSSQPVC